MEESDESGETEEEWEMVTESLECVSDTDSEPVQRGRASRWRAGRPQ